MIHQSKQRHSSTKRVVLGGQRHEYDNGMDSFLQILQTTCGVHGIEIRVAQWPMQWRLTKSSVCAAKQRSRLTTTICSLSRWFYAFQQDIPAHTACETVAQMLAAVPCRQCYFLKDIMHLSDIDISSSV